MTSELERRLRESLERHAEQAPQGDRLAELIIAEAVHGATPLRRRHRAWLFPTLAAAAVAAVVLSIVGVTTWRPHSAPHVQPGISGYRTVQVPTSTPSPKPTRATMHTHSEQPSPTVTRSSAPAAPVEVADFRAVDITFAGQNDGWALGTADCLSGSGRCPALLRTTDGAHWSVQGAGTPGFDVPGESGTCAAYCVSHIRFADDSVGYAYGPSALFMTTDGGATWRQQPGSGAEALETLDRNVIRLVDKNGAPCGAGCDLHAEIAPIGRSDWTSVALPGGALSRTGAQLARTGSAAYALVLGAPVGGGDTAYSTLFVSTDDGAHWTRHAGDPCPQVGGAEVDASAVTAGRSGVSVLCRPRTAGGAPFVAISTDGGRHFTGTAGRTSGNVLTGDPSTVLVAAGADATRSTDGGASWQPIPRLSGRPGGVSFIGFESSTVGRAVTDKGRLVWTTTDAGATWTPAQFSR